MLHWLDCLFNWAGWRLWEGRHQASLGLVCLNSGILLQGTDINCWQRAKIIVSLLIGPIYSLFKIWMKIVLISTHLFLFYQDVDLNTLVFIILTLSCNILSLYKMLGLACRLASSWFTARPLCEKACHRMIQTFIITIPMFMMMLTM